MNRKKKVKKELNNNNKTTYVFTKETLGMTLLLFSALILLMLLTGSSVFAGIGKAICTFMYGTFGYGSLIIIALVAYLGEWLIFGRKIKVSLKLAMYISLTAFFAFLLFHAATSRNISLDSYGGYISGCYKSASRGFSGYTFGGVVSAIIVYPVAKLATFVGTYVIFSLLLIISGYFLFVAFKKRRRQQGVYSNAICREEISNTKEYETVTVQPVMREPAPPMPQPVETVISREAREAARQAEEDKNPYSQKNLGRKIVFKKGEFDAESYRRNMIFNENSYFNHPVHNKEDYLNSFTSAKKTVASQSYSESYQEDVLNQPAVSAPTNYVFGDKPVDNLDGFEQASGEAYSVPQQYDVPVEKTEEEYSRTIRSEDNYRLNEPAVKPEPEIKPEKPVEPVKREEPKPEHNERLIERHDEEEDDKEDEEAATARAEELVELEAKTH